MHYSNLDYPIKVYNKFYACYFIMKHQQQTKQINSDQYDQVIIIKEEADSYKMKKSLQNEQGFQQLVNCNSQQNQKQQLIEYVGTEVTLKKDPKYQSLSVKIVSLISQSFFKVQTQFYVISISIKKDPGWQIKRRYSDFQWLFNTLMNNFPGFILPYFPEKSIQSFLVNKLNIEYGNISKQQTIQKRKQELELFLQGLCSHETLKYSQQLKIFLEENQLEFARLKKNFEAQTAQTQVTQSSGRGIFSIVQRSFAWIKTGAQHENQGEVEEIIEWQQTQRIIKNWVNQITETLQNIEKIVLLKTKQIQWQGPETEIDSVQILKAKVVSGRSFNVIFLDQIRRQIIFILDKHAKILKQIQYQISCRNQMKRMILYLRKNQGNQARSNKLLRKKEIFEKNLIKQWIIYQHQLKTQMGNIHNNFKNIWKKYCNKMNKIWK